MPINRSGIRSALRAWVLQATGLPDGKVIWSQQNAPRPTPPYITINDRLALASVGMDDERRLTETPGVIEHVGQRQLTISVNAYGTGAFDLLEAARDGLRLEVIRSALWDAGIGIIDPGNPQDLSVVLDTEWEERAQMDSFFHVVSRATEDVGYFDRAAYEGTFTSGGDPPSTITTSGIWT